MSICRTPMVRSCQTNRTALGWAAKDVGLVENLASEAGFDVTRNILGLGQRGVDVLDQLRLGAEAGPSPK